MEIASVQCPLATIISLSCCHNNYSMNIKVSKPSKPLSRSWVSHTLQASLRCLLSQETLYGKWHLLVSSSTPCYFRKQCISIKKIIHNTGGAEASPLDWQRHCHENCDISSNGSVLKEWRDNIAGGRIWKFCKPWVPVTFVMTLVL